MNNQELTNNVEMRGPPPEPVPSQNNAPANKHPHIIPFIAVSCGLFLVLVTLGVVRVITAEEKVCHVSATPTPAVAQKTSKVLGASIHKASPTAQPKIVDKKTPAATASADTKAVIKFPMDTPPYSVNIRQKPASDSATIALAKYGDTFEIISSDENWYQIKIASHSAGFIRAQYVERSK